MRKFTQTIEALVAVVVIAVAASAETQKVRFVYGATPCDETTDGANVRVHRCLGGLDANGKQRLTLDPFLVFDAYRNDAAAQFQGGFPAHPHRGFLELRYVTQGALAHNDSCGNQGLTTSGGIQALFSGRGIIHEERPMPEGVEEHKDSCSGKADSADDGACGSTAEPHRGASFRGFQIWLNVPHAKRDFAPVYRQYAPDAFQTYNDAAGAYAVTVFSGAWPGAPSAFEGPLTRTFPVQTGLLFGELHLPNAAGLVTIPIDPSQHVLLYSVEGTFVVGDVDEDPVDEEMLAFLGPGDVARIACVSSSAQPCRVLLLTAPRIREPVVVSGGFVARDASGIEAAFQDLDSGASSKC